MKQNMGLSDKIVRILAAGIIAVVYFSGFITGMLGIVLLVLAGIFVLTSLVGFCPLYTIFGISTCKIKSPKK